MEHRAVLHPTTNNEKAVVACVDVHLTASGSLAFLEAVRLSDAGVVIYVGYIINRIGRFNGTRVLEWLASGECVTSGDDGDRIIGRA